MPNTFSDGTSALGAAAGGALQQHFENAPIGMLLLGEDRTIVRGNETVASITGLAPAILSGSPFRRFLSTDAPLDLEDRIFEELEHSGRWLGEVEIRTSIGDTSPMLVAITPVADCAPVRYVVTVFELGNQRWIEAESSRRAAELSALSAIAVATGSSTDFDEMLQAAAREIVEGLEVDACWIYCRDEWSPELRLGAGATHLDPSLRLSSYMIPDPKNPALLRAAEARELVTESELLDRSIATVMHVPLLSRDDTVGVLSILSVEGEKLSTRSSDLLRAIGYKIGTAIQNVRLLESVRRQQQELKEKNDELETLVSQLLEADRLKNEFLANTSHELRTPLNSIIGFLNLVIDGLCENEEERMELLNHALTSGRHLLSLINDVLDLARMEAGRLQVEMGEVDLGAVLNEVAATMAVQAREKYLDLFCPPIPEGVRVSADESRLRQVFVNVIGNAIKFTPKGTVTIGLETPAGAPYVEVWVRDTGIGVGEEKMARLFHKFSQGDTSTTRKYGGTGLGLVIVKELVEMMGGNVRLESAGEGKGTRVTMRLARLLGGAPATGPSR
ncbi:MAG TPA: ATP-binding protein [Candidatus Eisenbacteria bacterium]|nr:ATP-binding protein [Candidatus Eisenbacteria bacterium]